MNCFPAFLTLPVLMVHNFYCNGNPPVQMLCYFGAQLRPILLEQDFVRGINREGNPAALGKKAHFNRPVNQLICHGYFVFSFAVIAFQQRFSIFICPREFHDSPLPV